MKSWKSVLLALILTFSSFSHFTVTSAVENQIVTDLIATADKAAWKSSYGDQAFPGKQGSKTGAALWLREVTMENDVEYPLVLQTLPDTKANGYIMGTYPMIAIPEKAKLNVEFGFPRGADKTKGVTFQISFYQAKSKSPALFSRFKTYTKSTEKTTIDMSNYAGKTGSFIVMVIGGSAPTLSDVATWSKIQLESEILRPDLVITDIQVKNNQVNYTIKNIGNANSNSTMKVRTHKSKLIVNGKEVSIDKVDVNIKPQEQIIRTFPDYLLPKLKIEQILIACSDYENIIRESNEQNNCFQKKVPPELEEGYPDLIITSLVIEDGKVTYKLKNIGKGTASVIRKGKLFQTKLSLDNREVAVDTLVKGLMPQDEVTRTFANYILPTSNQEQTLVICADSDDGFFESNEQNNCLTKKIPPEQVKEKPDLIISEIMVVKGKVSYTLKNIGKGPAFSTAKGKRFQTKLVLDEKIVAVDTILKGLQPLGEVTRTFVNYLLPDSNVDLYIFVCADSDDGFDESNEENNCIYKKVPPEPVEEVELRFVKLPEISDITQTSVHITWETNIESNSVVRYDTRFNLFESKKTENNLTKIHEITLTTLKPGTLYHFYVESSDVKDHTIRSKDDLFRTLTEPLHQNPTLQFTLPEKLEGLIKILPQLSNQKHFTKMKLFVDDKLFFANYSPPFEVELDTVKIQNGLHSFKIEGLDIIGNKITQVLTGVVANPDLGRNFGPVIDIITPQNLHEFPNTSEHVYIKAEIDHHQEFSIDHVSIYLNNVLVYRTRGKYWALKASLPKVFEYNIPISQFVAGRHVIEIKATDSSGKQTTKSVSVITHTPSWFEPEISVRYDTYIKEWTGNYYLIDFQIINNGTVKAKDLTISITQDFLPGFLITNVDQDSYSLSYSFTDNKQILTITLDDLDYTEGNNIYHIRFDLAPVITYFDYWREYVIINSVQVIYDWVDNDEYPTWETFDISYDAGIETQWMAKNCDYLIVSNLEPLIDSDSDTEPLEILLDRMSELAKKKQGIVALLNAPLLSADGFKTNILRFGDYLRADWTENGYLLLVGETEIIPTFSRFIDEGRKDYTFDTDAPYANTAGDEHYPELIIGRIIGDCIDCLIKPIQASLDVENGTAFFRRDKHPLSKALCLSGVGEGENAFWRNTRQVGEILEDEMTTVYKKRGEDIIDDHGNMYDEIMARDEGLSILFWRDHGANKCWCGDDKKAADSRSDSAAYAGNFNFGDFRPFIFACCCDSGQYSGIFGIANCLMNKAGAYISSTEVSARYDNNDYAKYFFNRWVNHPEKSLASAFKETRIESRDDTRWNLEYQFYGDAKFGITTP